MKFSIFQKYIIFIQISVIISYPMIYLFSSLLIVFLLHVVGNYYGSAYFVFKI